MTTAFPDSRHGAHALAMAQGESPGDSMLVDCLVSNPVILDCMLGFCTPATIVRLARTCTSSRLAILSFFHRAFNINRHLSRYFSDSIGFRLLQSRTGAVISGSNALQFLDRSFYPGSDLDLYVPWRRLRDLAQWVTQDGYVFQPNASQSDILEDSLVRIETTTAAIEESNGPPPYSMRGVVGVFTFLRPVENRGGDSLDNPEPPRKIQIVAALTSVADVIINFHSSTCVPRS